MIERHGRERYARLHFGPHAIDLLQAIAARNDRGAPATRRRRIVEEDIR